MPRSIWKRLFTYKKDSIPSYTYDRSLIITPDFIDHTINIHNGKQFIPLTINVLHVGKKLGEFSSTKYPARYKLKKTDGPKN